MRRCTARQLHRSCAPPRERLQLTDVRKYLDLLESDEILTYEEPIIRHAE